MKTGLYLSGGVHGALVLWALVGGIFQRPPDAGIQVSTVSVISTQDFEALSAPAAGGAPNVPAPDLPSEEPETPEPETPEPERPPDPVPEPATPEPAPDPEPDPEPVAEPDPEPPTDGEAVALVDAPPQPVDEAIPDGAALVLAPETAPTPRRAPRIASEPVAVPEPEAAPSETVAEATQPTPSETPQPEPPEEDTTAPEEAVARTEPDAEEVPSGGTLVAALAPTGSPRPAARPRRPERTSSEQPATQSAPSADPQAEALAAALAEARGGPSLGDPGQGNADAGPPITSGEREAFRLAIRQCWNLNTLSSEAMRATVTVALEMDRDGKPVLDSIRLIESTGGPAAKQAYEAARRALIRCGVNGYDLPEEKFAQWREVEIVFNPEKMRLR